LEAGSSNLTLKDSIVTCRIVPSGHGCHATARLQDNIGLERHVLNAQYAYVACKPYRFTSLLSPDPERPPQKKTKENHARSRRRGAPSLLERTLIRFHADSVRKRYSLDIDAPLITDSDTIIIVDDEETMYDGLDTGINDQYEEMDDDDEFDDDEEDEIIDDFEGGDHTSSNEENSIEVVMHDGHEDSETKLDLRSCGTGMQETESGAGASDSDFIPPEVRATGIPVSTKLISIAVRAPLIRLREDLEPAQAARRWN